VSLPPVADWLDLPSVLAAALIITISGCGAEVAGSLPAPPPAPRPSPQLQRIQIAPKTPSLFPGGLQQFTATALWSTTQAGSLTLAFEATGGSVTNAGLYAAGQDPGSYRVIASAAGYALADTALVSILPPPIPGQYTTLISQDWSKFPDKASVRALFGVEGQLNNCGMAANKALCDPALPVDEFFDLVDDPLFGKVIRYNGDPKLNTTLTTMPGRVAVHGKNFPPMSNVWVRQYVKFSPNYTTVGVRGGQGGASHKMMFLRYESSSARHAWILEGARGMTQEHGGAQGTVVNEGPLAFNNTRTMDDIYNVTGWARPDAYPMIKAPAGPRDAPTGDGNGEWYEMIMHHKAVGVRGEHTIGWRQYTVNGVVNPQSWQWDANYIEFQAGQTWKSVSRYEMGVNRNRQWDENMYIFWGPYEVVNGSLYPNPWSLPGQ
jgi:hypothetical protein